MATRRVEDGNRLDFLLQHVRFGPKADMCSAQADVHIAQQYLHRARMFREAATQSRPLALPWDRKEEPFDAF
jgi:hypothetical protein